MTAPAPTGKRFCPVCEQADLDPRHVIYVPGSDPKVAKHLDCCASVGCPDGSCPILLADADGKTGDALRKHLTDPKTAAKAQKALDARDDATRHFTLADIDPSAQPTTLTETQR